MSQEEADQVKRKLLGLELCPKCGEEVRPQFSPSRELTGGMTSASFTECPNCNQVLSYNSPPQQYTQL